jgi:hypothetical protein
MVAAEWRMACTRLRETDEPKIRGVGAGYTNEDGWFVDIWAQEFFRQDPLGVELRQRVQAALGAVDGVTAVEEGDNESWQVAGKPSGEALVQAAHGSWMIWRTACGKPPSSNHEKLTRHQRARASEAATQAELAARCGVAGEP